MCEAVAVCHDVGVFHRDIKPENFIVTDGWVVSPSSHSHSPSASEPSEPSTPATPIGPGESRTEFPRQLESKTQRQRQTQRKHQIKSKRNQHQNGNQKRRRVIVKLTDFGLSTRDAASRDMECGSAPYMSYECRNNCAPTYSPRCADVWSLGIVLINMYAILFPTYPYSFFYYFCCLFFFKI